MFYLQNRREISFFTKFKNALLDLIIRIVYDTPIAANTTQLNAYVLLFLIYVDF